MEFNKEHLQEIVGLVGRKFEVDGHEMELIVDDIVDHSRWSVIHEFVIKWNDRYFGGCYSVGATEMQDECPFEYDDDPIELTELEPVEVTHTEYKPV